MIEMGVGVNDTDDLQTQIFYRGHDLFGIAAGVEDIAGSGFSIKKDGRSTEIQRLIGRSLRAAIEDRSRQFRHKFEAVINHEEKGYYLMGMTEKRISDMVKIGSQMDFYYDSQKYISEEYDSIRIGGYFAFTF